MTSSNLYSKSERAYALLLGIVCHTTFAMAVGAMMWKLYTGLHGSLTFPFLPSLSWDLLLILQFPLLHSFLLTDKGARVLGKLAPGSMGADLRTTTFALIASLQLLLTFLAWAPLGPVWFEWHGLPRLLSTGAYVFGWVLLMKSMSDAGLGVQMGSLGWWAVFRNRKPQYRPWTPRGTLRSSRHPMYLAYTLLVWTGPVWSLDHALLAGIWTCYCVLAPLHKEARYRKRYGDRFRTYQKTVPYFLPRFVKTKTTR
ncbi:MAG: isoprenylcysteine carboxylmethyltransferase family protein [Kiritimatiellae bacterium]|jgi:protein-S-isoprenylcysteine O-methyltransferase Ste14|nr:isoprenylcysteine carboxylmethyltransferase family protein [Kiritimatiellia bacterium]